MGRNPEDVRIRRLPAALQTMNSESKAAGKFVRTIAAYIRRAGTAASPLHRIVLEAVVLAPFFTLPSPYLILRQAQMAVLSTGITAPPVRTGGCGGVNGRLAATSSSKPLKPDLFEPADFPASCAAREP